MNQQSRVNINNKDNQFSSDGAVHKAKAAPQSRFETEECSSNDELSKVCFKGSLSPVPILEISCVSSESSVSSDSEASVSDCTLRKTDTVGEVEEVLCSYMRNGTCLQVNKLSVSRQGRDLQRWDEDQRTSSLIRLTTGAVPITNDGRIVLVSSAKKREWILPKGGWEIDESMEESALRETFEEAGLLGMLGPRLSDVTFETRKAKKRRLENSLVSTLSISTLEEKDISTFTPPVTGCESCKTCAPPRTDLPSQPKKYDMCRMSLFICYVTKVLDNWPESGRARKLCTIDEALEITRPEFKEVLLEVKKKGLYLPTDLN